MINKKLILVCFIFMLVAFVVHLLVSFSINEGFDLKLDEYIRILGVSFFMGVFMGIAIKFKWIKSKDILKD